MVTRVPAVMSDDTGYGGADTGDRCCWISTEYNDGGGDGYVMMATMVMAKGGIGIITHIDSTLVITIAAIITYASPPPSLYSVDHQQHPSPVSAPP